MNITILLYINLLLVFVVLLGLIFGLNSITVFIILGFMIIITLLLIVYAFYFIFCLIRENKSFVPFVPTPMKIVREMIVFAGIKVDDIVYDMGCGDGRLVTEASKITGNKSIGIEWKLDVAMMGWVRNFFKKGKAIIKRGDMYKEDISDADVIFTYLLPHAMDKLETKITKECKDSVVIVSHGFVFKNLKLQEEKNIGNITIRRYGK